jgi:alkylated DNA nucleotide flippase Atl1
MYRGVQKKRELASEYVFGGASVQKKLLEADGIEVVDGKVDLSKYAVETNRV